MSCAHTFYFSTNQKGSAMIEMAIVLPVFIGLLVAIIDFGMYFNIRNVAQSAAWNGAKACVDTKPPAPIVQATLSTILSSTAVQKINPTCSTETTGGVQYQKVIVKVKGGMLSPFTTALGLYPITVTGIAN